MEPYILCPVRFLGSHADPISIFKAVLNWPQEARGDAGSEAGHLEGPGLGRCPGRDVL